jgi:hypothetical protein
MPTPPVPFSDIKHTVEVYHQFLDEGWSAHPAPKGQPSALTMAQRELGFNPATTVVTANRLDIAVALGIKVREWRTAWGFDPPPRRRPEESSAAGCLP